jgi:FkbM family methyltransferase
VNYFIDAGCHNGDSVIEFFNWYTLLGDPFQFRVHAFDPTIRYGAAWASLEAHYPVSFHQQAVWVEDSTTTFYEHEQDVSSTLVPEKQRRGTPTLRPVETLDFARFLRELLRPEDYCLVKLDIEGAEYAVLERLIREGIDTQVAAFLVEFHDDKMPAAYRERHLAIAQHLGRKLKDWR